MLYEALQILPGWKRTTPGQPNWYLRLRSAVAICGLIGVAIYSILELLDYLKGYTYIVTSLLDKNTDPGYNGTFPFLGIISVQFPWASPSMDASCWLIYKSLERSCSSVYNISDISRVTVQEVSFSPFLWNPPYFSDSDACSSPSLGLLPCNGIESIIMAFQPSNNASFPPRAYARVALSSGSPAIGVASNAEPSNLGLSPNTFQTFDFSVKPGEVLYVNLLYTINYPVQGNFYYDYSYQTYNAPSLFMLNNTAAWIYVNARTEIVTKNVEKYVLPFGNLLGLIGGLYGVIVSVFAILFGMGAITPWGIVPRYILYAGLAKNMKKEFNEAEGLDKSGSPLSDIIPEADLRNPQYDAAALRNDVDYLRNRLRKLERVLELYYLDKGLLSHIASGEGPHASDANYYDDQQTKFPATAHYEMTTNSS